MKKMLRTIKLWKKYQFPRDKQFEDIKESRINGKMRAK